MVDAVGEFADSAFHPLERRGARSGGSKEVAHLLRLPPDALEGLGFDRRRSEAVDLAADGADLAFEPDGDRLRVVRLQRQTQLGRHRLERRKQRFGMAGLTRHLDPLHEVPDRALERDHRIARREVGEALAHSRDLGPHGAKIDRRAARLALLAPEVVELEREGSNIVANGFRQLRRRGAFRNGGQRVEVVGGRGGLCPRRRVRARRRHGGIDAGAQLVAAHGDLRHCALEIERRRRRHSLAGLSRAGPAGMNRFQPPGRIDQSLPIAVARRIRALEDLGDRFERPRGTRFSAREPRLEAVDRRIERVRNLRRSRSARSPVSPRYAFEASRGRV